MVVIAYGVINRDRADARAVCLTTILGILSGTVRVVNLRPVLDTRSDRNGGVLLVQSRVD